MLFHHVVAAIDFSTPSGHALASAASFARLVGARLSVLHVRERGDEDPAGMRAFVARWLDRDTAPEKVLQVEQVGHPAFATVDWADAHSVDMIFCGSHGRSGLARMLLGSVAEKLVRHARCPVWVVRSEGGLHPQRILLPTDLTPLCETATRLAVYLAVGFDCRLDVLHVIDAPERQTGIHGQLEAYYEEVRALAEKGLASIESEDKLAISRDIAVGKPSARIVEAAETLSADLIVCGTHSRVGVDRWLLGSVAERLVRQAPCSVIVAPFSAA